MTDLGQLEYPRHIHWPSVPGQWKSRIVANAEQAAAALAEGGSLIPIILRGDEPITPVTPPPDSVRKTKRGRP